MDHYLDIRLLPDPEFSTSMLMNALYSKLHRALVSLKADNIGVSFPEYNCKPKSLGGLLRVHGSHSSLCQLQEADWLKGMKDHTTITDIQPIPSGVRYYQVKRRQYKTSADRLRRRRMKRKGETYEEATQAIPDSVERCPDLPFLTLRSLSTGQTFCLFIEQVVLQDQPVVGEFSCYGLSQRATVPCF